MMQSLVRHLHVPSAYTLVWIFVNAAVLTHIAWRSSTLQENERGTSWRSTATFVTHGRSVAVKNVFGNNESFEECGTINSACPLSTDAEAATVELQRAAPEAYLNTSMCEELGPTCVQDGELTLYASRFQPTGGVYHHVELPVFRELARIMYVVARGDGNGDTYVGTLARFAGPELIRAWPAGGGSADAAPLQPPTPFSEAAAPVLLWWDFPDNYWHTMAAYTSVWCAVRSGALDARSIVVLALPPPGAHTPREYVYAPPATIFSGGVTTLANLGAAMHGSTAEHKRSAAADAGSPHSARSGARVVLPRAACFASITACTVAGYHLRPPREMYHFMQHLARLTAAGRRRQDKAPKTTAEIGKDNLSDNRNVGTIDDPLPTRELSRGNVTAPHRPSPHTPNEQPFALSPSGVLRIVLALRGESGVGSRSIVNEAEVLRHCASLKSVSLRFAYMTNVGHDDRPNSTGDAASSKRRVPASCSSHDFGSGLEADIERMLDTDVLIGVHGAGLTNAGFLRHGSSVVELRPASLDAANADRFFRPLAAHSRAIKWWGAVLHARHTVPGAMEAASVGNAEKWGRDKNVAVPWSALLNAIAEVVPLTWEAWALQEPYAVTHIV